MSKTTDDEKKLKTEIKESSKTLIENLDKIEGEVNRIIDALKKEGISQAVINLSFLSLFDLLEEQDRLLRELAGIRNRKIPLGTSGKTKVQIKDGENRKKKQSS